MMDELDFTEPVLPYAGTSGFSGSDTSEARARGRDRDGSTAKLQQDILEQLSLLGATGATWSELGEKLGLHHGTISGGLSILHKAGVIARLVERRGRSKVYVIATAGNVAGRMTEEQGRRRSRTAITCSNCGHHNLV